MGPKNEVEDDQFNKEFSSLVQTAYKDLFEIHGDRAWALDRDSLITFFRHSDDTSAVIGGRQAGVFLALAGLSGHGELPAAKKASTKTPQKVSSTSKAKAQTKTAKATSTPAVEAVNKKERDVGLTVRIEINLPADGLRKPTIASSRASART